MAISTGIILLFFSVDVSAADCNFPGENLGAINQEEIPSSYTEPQLVLIEQLFSETWNLTKGVSQMSESEFCELHSKFANFTEERSIDLLFKDIWILIKGSAQMSADEFNELRAKYYLKQYGEMEVQEDKEEIVDARESETKAETELKESKQEKNDREQPTISNEVVPLSSKDSKIILNPLSDSTEKTTITTNKQKSRKTIFYSFLAFLMALLLLLALRRL